MEFPRDLGAHLEFKHACVVATVTAAAAGDNAETDGETIDRVNAHSAAFGYAAKATLTEDETLIVKATLQDSADGTNWDDVAAALQPEGAANSTIMTLTGGSGGSTEEGVYQHDVDLSSLRRYVRNQIHVDLSAGATDTGTAASVCALNRILDT